MSPAIPQENPKLEAQNTREELQKLRQSIELNAADPNRLRDIKDSAARLNTSYEALRQKIETFKTTQPMHPDIPKYASILTAFDAVDIDGDPSMTEAEFFAAVTDGLIASDPANPALLQYEKLAVQHITDEEKSLAAVMSVGAKFESAITGFVEKAQKKFGGAFGQLEAFGISIGASDIARYLMSFVADYIDSFQVAKLRPLRGLSKQLREYQGIMEARANGITNPTIIQEGIASWNTKYDEWMKQTEQDPKSTLPMPKLYEDHILLAQKRSGFEDLQAHFDLMAQPLFGPTHTIELTFGGAPKAVRPAVGPWTISLPDACIEGDGSVGYNLNASGENFKKLFDVVQAEPALMAIEKGPLAAEGAKLTADLNADITVARLQRILRILPRGNYSSVKLETDPALSNFAEPLARFENGTLFVNKATLDADATVNALAGTAAALGPDPKKLQWNAVAGIWNIT